MRRRAAERGDDCGLQGHGDAGHLTVADSHSARGLRGGGEVRERGVWVRRRKEEDELKKQVKHTQELEKQSSLRMSVRSLRTVRVCVGPDR